MKIGPDEFPVILEDGDYENLDRVRLNWTVNNLFESVYDFEILERGSSRKFHINGREVETNLYIIKLGRGSYSPKIKSSSNKRIGYYDIIEKNWDHYLLLSREFIEAFIEASSKYAEVTDELNDFIDRLNRVKSEEIDNLTEAQIDSMLLFDSQSADEFAEIEKKRDGLREIRLNLYFKSTNVFWIEENTEVGRHFYGVDAEPLIIGEVIYYLTKGMLSLLSSTDSWEKVNYDLPPPSNFDPRSHTEPDAEPFIWVPAGKWEFINENGQWKLAISIPGT